MALRPATTADVSALHRVRMLVRENRLSDASLVTERDYVAHLTRLGLGWVSEERGAIVGFSIGRLTDGNVWALFVDPAHEGSGHGSKLHDALIGSLFAAGLDSLWLTTEAGTRAEHFYLRKGWLPSPPHPAGEIRLVRRAS